MPEMIGDRERPLKAEDEAKLRTLLGLKEGVDLPPPIKAAYWKRKRLSDRLGYHGLSDDSLMSVVIDAGQEAPPPAQEAWLLTAVRDGAIKAQDKITVRIAGKTKPAKFVRIAQDGQRARVHVDGDGDERLVPVVDVIGG